MLWDCVPVGEAGKRYLGKLVWHVRQVEGKARKGDKKYEGGLVWVLVWPFSSCEIWSM